jgi:hypothetical protein
MTCVPGVGLAPTRTPSPGFITQIQGPFRSIIQRTDPMTYQFIACQWIDCLVQRNGGGLMINAISSN